MKLTLKRGTLLLGVALASSLASAGHLSPELLARAKAGDKTPVGVIVRFSVKDTPGGRALFKNLRQQLQSNIAKLGPAAGFVNNAIKQGGRELWLDQSVYVKMTPVEARTLATLPIVDEIFLNFKVQIPRVKAQSTVSAPAGVPSHLQQVGAPAAWAAGFKGKGVRIGHLDSGIDASHPELKGKVLSYAEFDGDGKQVQSQPHDTTEHGTHTAGLLVGNTVGVAPDAKLISALVLPNNEGTFAEVIAGMQWVLDPDNNADTNDGANVVSMSLGLPGTYQEFVQPVQNMLKAGVVPVFAIGNYGPSASSTGSPGNIPDAIGVGAVDGNNQVASFSSRGPVAWTGAYSGVFVKPDIAAPGSVITSSFPGGGYGALSGSSQAAPIAAGAVAVLLSAKPGSSVDTVKNALYSSASNASAKNNDVGYGVISIPGALAKLGVSAGVTSPQPNQAAPAQTEQPAASQPAPSQPAVPAASQPNNQPPAAQPAASEPAQNPAAQPTQQQSSTKPTASAPAAQPSAPSGYTLCALEGGVCHDVANRDAAFGAAGHYIFAPNDASPTFNCTVTEWGGQDPAPGQAKGCFVKNQAATQTPAAPAQTQPTSGEKPSILLVDDSRGGNLIAALRDTVKGLAKAGGAFAWNTQTQGSPPASELKKYDVVLWLTGEQYQNTIDAQEQQALTQYLQGGGRLIVSGQDVGYDIGSGNFYRQTLRTQFVADASGNSRFVSSGALDSGNYTLNAAGSLPDQYYPDVIAPLSGSLVGATWGSAGANAGTIQAQSIKVDPVSSRSAQKTQDPRGLLEEAASQFFGDLFRQAFGNPRRVRAQSASEAAGAIVLNDAGKYRSVTMGFGLEGLAPAERATLLKNTLNWLMK